MKHLIRCCERTYEEKPLKDVDIQVTEFMFDDGGIPKIENITEWLKVVDEFYDNNKEEQAVLESAQKENNKK